MQAIARVNRVFRDKPGGLVVDYIGLANSVKQALAAYVDETAKLRWAEECGSAADWVAARTLPRSGGDAQAVREPQEGRRGGARLRMVSGIAS